MPHNLNTKYRPDIDGLRAIAVIGVMIFHFFPSKLKGGFIGVDVFLVISGFLITRIIAGSLKKDRFSFKHFYANRIKRIFPALSVVLIATFVFGWFVFFHEELEELRQHIIASVFFVENFKLLFESGYFDTDSLLKPLLHLWSLSVEEQFYIFFPFILWVASRFKKDLFNVLCFLSLVSFVLNVTLVSTYPDSGYFMLHTRMWELFAGGILALFPAKFPRLTIAIQQKKRLMNGLSVLGFLLIIVAMFVIHKKYIFPGWWAILPIVGSVLIIFAGKDAYLNKWILSNKLAVGLGLISYPLYLWHWPIVSYISILASRQPSVELRVYGFILSIVLATVTYFLVERPIRFTFKSRFRTPALVSFMLGIAVLGFLAQGTSYLADQPRGVLSMFASLKPEATVEEDQSINLEDGCAISDRSISKKLLMCKHDKRRTPHFALIGDSKAHSLSSGLLAKSTDKGRFLFVAGNMAQFLYNKKPSSQTALLPLKAILDDSKITVVVMTIATRTLFQDLKEGEITMKYLPESYFYNKALEGLSQMVSSFVMAGKKVVITLDNPTFPDILQCRGRLTALSWVNDIFQLDKQEPCQIAYQKHLEYTAQYRKLIEEIQVQNPDKVRLFDTLDVLCDKENDLCTSFMKNRALYSYTDHISYYASNEIAEQLIPFVEQFADEE